MILSNYFLRFPSSMQFILASFAVDLTLVFGGLAVFFVDSTAKGFSIIFISQQYLSSGVHFPQTSPSCGLRRPGVNGTSFCWLVAARRRHQVSSALIWFNFLARRRIPRGIGSFCVPRRNPKISLFLQPTWKPPLYWLLPHPHKISDFVGTKPVQRVARARAEIETTEICTGARGEFYFVAP